MSLSLKAKAPYSGLTLSPHLPRSAMSSPSFNPTFGTSPSSFGSRRGNPGFSSGRYSVGRGSGRSRKGPLLSFRSSRRTAPRPTRTKGIFTSLLKGLTDGIQAVRVCVEEMKTQLPSEPPTGSRMNYYMDLEKQVKSLERKMRTMEVHKDRIEEMRDEYILKIKLREGAFNLAQALSSQSSKAAKEKLQEVRLEQRDLMEDLSDIEDELETKLGVFKVHINGLVGVSRTGDVFETQLKLGSQKWKAKCKMSRQQQIWQDADIIFLGKIMDELYVKVIEVRRIQGNVHVGTMKCLSRELFSFLPQSLTFNFPNSSSTKLSMDVRWVPTIGDEFLTDLDLQMVHCFVDARGSRGSTPRSSVFNVQRLQVDPQISGVNVDPSVHQIRILTEPDDELMSSNSYSRKEVKTHSVAKTTAAKKKKKRKDEDMDFVYIDRSTIMSPNGMKDYPEAKQFLDKDKDDTPSPTSTGNYGNSMKQRRNSLSSSASGSDSSSFNQPPTPRSMESLSLMGLVEVVFAAMEEPRDQFPELRPLDIQLARLESALKGGQLTRTPSMTFSESQAMDSFDFLGGEDAALLPRFSRASFSSDLPDKMSLTSDPRSISSAQKFHSTPSQDTPDFSQTSFDSQTDEVFATGSSSGYQEGSESCGGSSREEERSTGLENVDRALVQHLLHCEYLLQHLQSAGPLNYRQTTSLRRLQHEAEVLSELLNIAADPTTPIKIDRILPELAAQDELFQFWKTLTKDDLLSVSYEAFAVSLDEKFGQNLWSDFPEVANKVFAEILSRILDLDPDCAPADARMVVTVFQYSSYFLSHGSNGIFKCMREVAQELTVTEGLYSGDEDTKLAIASQLKLCSYNRGALLVSAHFLSDRSATLKKASRRYLMKFAGNSPWHSKAVQFFIQLLENSDQTVRTGACIALGELGAKSAAPQLRYLAKGDFTPVRNAASRALAELGEPESSSSMTAPSGGIGKPVASSSLESKSGSRKQPLTRTRSAEYTLSS